MNAIKDGGLTGFRDNRNRWQINSDDLSKWLTGRSGNSTVKAVRSDSQKQPAPNGNAIRVAVLEAEIKGKDQRISDLERDRDDWKAQAQELARRDAPGVQPSLPARRRRWWPF